MISSVGIIDSTQYTLFFHNCLLLEVSQCWQSFSLIYIWYVLSSPYHIPPFLFGHSCLLAVFLFNLFFPTCSAAVCSLLVYNHRFHPHPRVPPGQSHPHSVLGSSNSKSVSHPLTFICLSWPTRLCSETSNSPRLFQNGRIFFRLTLLTGNSRVTFHNNLVYATSPFSPSSRKITTRLWLMFLIEILWLLPGYTHDNDNGLLVTFLQSDSSFTSYIKLNNNKSNQMLVGL